VVDRVGKARALLRFAEAYGVPLNQTVAVASDGAVDLLAPAGLGVILRSVPAGESQPARDLEPAAQGRYLDGLLLLLGVSPGQLDQRAGTLPAFAGRNTATA
jgi:phosphoserine phosphatase